MTFNVFAMARGAGVPVVVIASMLAACSPHPGDPSDAQAADGATDAMAAQDSAPADPATHDPALIGRWRTTLTSPDDPEVTVIGEMDFAANGTYSGTSTANHATTARSEAGCSAVSASTGGTWSTSAGGAIAASLLTQTTSMTTGCVAAADDRGPETSHDESSAVPPGTTYTATSTQLTLTVPQSSFSVVLVFDRVD